MQVLKNVSAYLSSDELNHEWQIHDIIGVIHTNQILGFVKNYNLEEDMRKTKIICTLGPAVDDEATLRQLIENGMNCCRLNFSHGTHEEQKVRMDRVKRLREEMKVNLPILLDTKGPEIRLKNFEHGFADLKTGQDFTLATGDALGNEEQIPLTYDKLAQSIHIGTRILIDDGKIAMDVKEIQGENVVCTVINGGRISNHKSINVPNVVIPMPYMSDTDKSDILFGIEQEVDYIAASFVRTAADVHQLRDFLVENGAPNIRIISKIENVQGVERMDEIIDASDGIMVARGDLGVEIPFRELPSIQKEMIHKCYLKGKEVVTATQMLESMTKNPRPTRAEVSDVANAIFDGTTCIMLSGESAAGDYPAEAVKTMAEIADSAEAAMSSQRNPLNENLRFGTGFTDAIAISACTSADYLNAKAIIVLSRTGATARTIANYRPACPIIAIVVEPRCCRQLNLSYGVCPVQATLHKDTKDLFEYAINKAKTTGLVKSGDNAVLIGGSSIAAGSPDDLLKLCQVP